MYYKVYYNLFYKKSDKDRKETVSSDYNQINIKTAHS